MNKQNILLAGVIAIILLNYVLSFIVGYKSANLEMLVQIKSIEKKYDKVVNQLNKEIAEHNSVCNVHKLELIK